MPPVARPHPSPAAARDGGWPVTVPTMTRTSAPDSLTLRSPDSLLSALPYLLGFDPEHSLVMVWLRDGRIHLTQRLDLPFSAAAAQSDQVGAARYHGDLEQWHHAIWAHAAANSCTEVIVLWVCEGPVPIELVDRVMQDAEHHRLDVRDVLRSDSGRWWSLLCSDPACCPVEGRAINESEAAEVAAEFALAGRAPRRVRADVEAEFVRDECLAAEVAAVALPRAPRRGPAREQWRDERIKDLLDLIEAPEATSDAIAHALVALGDVRVRDTTLWSLLHASSPETWADVLTRLLRAAPDGRVAPVGTCCAIAHWLSGDGMRSRLAVERARADDPGYSLAALVHMSLAAGLPPRAWRDAMSELTRDDCRHGPTRVTPDQN